MNARERVRGFFFAPSTPVNLAVCRIFFCGWLFCFFACYDVSAWARMPADAFRPVWFVALFGPLPGPVTLAAIGVAWKVSLLLCALGLWHRVSFGLAAVLGAYALALTGSFGKDNYDVSLPVILLFVFWVARASDALSLDARRARRRGVPPPTPSGEYTWPIALARVLLSLVFFAAGAAKLRHAGLAWITTDSLRWLFIAQQYRDPPLDWALYLARFPWLCRLAAGGTVALELGYPLALVSARLRPWIVLAVITLQLAILLLLGVDYLAFLVVNVVWVDWAALGRRVHERRRRP